MESKRRQASTANDALYRMESMTPAMMDNHEDDNLDDMMSSDEDEQIISSTSKMSKMSSTQDQSRDSDLFGGLPTNAEIDAPELDLPHEHFKNMVKIGKSSTQPKLEQILE